MFWTSHSIFCFSSPPSSHTSTGESESCLQPSVIIPCWLPRTDLLQVPTLFYTKCWAMADLTVIWLDETKCQIRCTGIWEKHLALTAVGLNEKELRAEETGTTSVWPGSAAERLPHSKNIEQYQSQYRPLRDTTSYWSAFEHLDLDCYPLDAVIQWIVHPLNPYLLLQSLKTF